MGLEVEFEKKIGNFELCVKFHALSGSHLGILGASGCGKSMTLKCIAGIVKPDTGRIVLNGKVLFDSEKKINLSPQKRNVGYLFQNYALFPNMTVEENIAIGISNTKNKAGKAEIVRSLIGKFHLEELEERIPSELSGGQQQRVALARMLASEPDMIMLDEPFSALDSFLKEELQRELYHIMKDYKGEVLMVSHNRDEIFKLTEKLAIMDEGKIIIHNDTKAIFEDPQNIEAAKLTGCKNISRAMKIGDYEVEALDWNMKLHTIQKVGDDIAYVGVRAHHIEIESNEGSNADNDRRNTSNTSKTSNTNKVNRLSVYVSEKLEMPFDTNYILKNVNGSSGEIWFQTPTVSRKASDSDNQGNPSEEVKAILLPSERLLLLR